MINNKLIDYKPFTARQTEYMAKCHNSWLNVAEGGKRAGKNVSNILSWALQLEQHPDKLHLASGVSIATAKLNIIDSNGYGLKFWFKGRCREGKYNERTCLYISTISGEKIILISGGGKEGDEKLIKGNSYGTAYITEANECCQPFIKEVFDRTLSSSNRQIYLDINPKNPNHWFYREILDFHLDNAKKYPDYRMNYGHFTIFDNLSIAKKMLKEILRTYNKASLWFKRDILGQRIAPEGTIYDMFDHNNLYDDGHGPNYDLAYRRYFCTDYGTINPFVILEIIEQRGFYYVDSEFYYESKVEYRQKEDSEYVDDTIKYIGQKQYVCDIVDPSAASYKVAARRKGIRLKDADNTVLDGIRLMASLIGIKHLKVNRQKCPHFQNEITGYVWNPKAAERGEEEPVKSGDHCMDACRYFCKTIVKVIPTGR